MGFNSGGLDAVIDRLHRRPCTAVVGVNLGKNRNSSDAVADYAEGIRRAAEVANYLVVNVSSPNTPGLRDLQCRARLQALLAPLLRTRDESPRRVPLLVKIAPDLTPEEREDITSVALAAGIDGLIVSNTTVDRPAGLFSPYAIESGGLSGRPLFAASTSLLADMYRLTGGRLPLIGVGGVASAAEAYQKIRAGACLVQLYTALVFAGPSLVTDIKKGLAELLRRDGFTCIAEAVGAKAAHSRSSLERAAAADAPS
jgi:dihydroorotate dehydrogenase